MKIIFAFFLLIQLALATQFKHLYDNAKEMDNLIAQDKQIDASALIEILGTLHFTRDDFQKALGNYASHLRPLTKEEKIKMRRLISRKLGISRKASSVLTEYMRKQVEEAQSEIPSDKMKISPNPSFVPGKSEYVYDYCRRNAPIFPRLNPDPTSINIPWRGFSCGETHQDRKPGPSKLSDKIWAMSDYSGEDRALIESIPDLQTYLQRRPSFSEKSKAFVCHYLDPHFGYGGYDDYCFPLPAKDTLVTAVSRNIRDCQEGTVLGAIMLPMFGSLLVIPAVLTSFVGLEARQLLRKFIANLVAAGIVGQSVQFIAKSASPSCDGDGWGLTCGTTYLGVASVTNVIQYLREEGCPRFVSNTANCFRRLLNFRCDKTERFHE